MVLDQSLLTMEMAHKISVRKVLNHLEHILLPDSRKSNPHHFALPMASLKTKPFWILSLILTVPAIVVIIFKWESRITYEVDIEKERRGWYMDMYGGDR
jgi:magnesium-transporting ATPase (P-type)